MLRTLIGAALATTFAATLGAQATPQTTTNDKSDRDRMTISGCLERDANGNFVLNNVQGRPTVGTTGTTTTEEHRGKASDMRGRTWKLEGSAHELNQYVGERVQITGRANMKDGAKSAASTTTTEEHRTSSDFDRVLHVQSVKSIASRCL